jgi:hypothetical protein
MTGPLVALGGAAVAVTSVVVVKEVSKESAAPPPTSLRHCINNIEGGDQWMMLPPHSVVFLRGGTSAAKPRNGYPNLEWRHLSPPLLLGASPPVPHTLYLLPRNLTISLPHLFILVMEH